MTQKVAAFVLAQVCAYALLAFAFLHLRPAEAAFNEGRSGEIAGALKNGFRPPTLGYLAVCIAMFTFGVVLAFGEVNALAFFRRFRRDSGVL